VQVHLFSAEDGLDDDIKKMLNARITDVKNEADHKYVKLLKAFEDL